MGSPGCGHHLIGQGTVGRFLQAQQPWVRHGLMAPLGGVERPRRAVRFARLMHRRVRVLGGPTVRAASGGNLSLAWLLPTVVRRDQAA
jgi:hypothetical protein